VGILPYFHKQGGKSMKIDAKPLANLLLVRREEFDDWAVLFNPDTGDSFGLNPVSKFIFKLLDDKNTLADIMKELRAECKNAPKYAEKYVHDFIEDCLKKGFSGHEFQQG